MCSHLLFFFCCRLKIGLKNIIPSSVILKFFFFLQNFNFFFVENLHSVSRYTPAQLFDQKKKRVRLYFLNFYKKASDFAPSTGRVRTHTKNKETDGDRGPDRRSLNFSHFRSIQHIFFKSCEKRLKNFINFRGVISPNVKQIFTGGKGNYSNYRRMSTSHLIFFFQLFFGVIGHFSCKCGFAISQKGAAVILYIYIYKSICWPYFCPGQIHEIRPYVLNYSHAQLHHLLLLYTL